MHILLKKQFAFVNHYLDAYVSALQYEPEVCQDCNGMYDTP